MPLTVEPLPIPAVRLVRPQRFDDARGYFLESYNARAFKAAGIGCDFVQDNQSLSTRRGTVRGLHFQVPPVPQAKLVRVLRGSIFDVAVDLRRGGPTYGQWCATILTARGCEQLFVPEGFAHGFCTLEPDTEVAYKVSGLYAPECDAGLAWDDPLLAIAWPIDAREVTVSERDAGHPGIAAFASPFQFTPGDQTICENAI
jgi:dTDP-4-dehydrorhamnose 3,5-epimerase